MVQNSILNVTVLGCGILGSQIAFHTAFKGLNVTLNDINTDAFSDTMRIFGFLKDTYISEFGIEEDRIDQTLSNILFSFDLKEAVSNADLVIEAIPEDMELKKKLYLELSEIAPPQTIFATNSSTFIPSALMEFTGRPEKFLSLHFSNAIWKANIVEVMGCRKTDPAIYASAVDFVNKIGMVPIELKKENPGYVLNSLLIPFLSSACELLVKGIADVDTIDKTWTSGTGSPIGPFEIIDLIGINTFYNIIISLPDPKTKLFAAYIEKEFIKKGKLGIFSGEGFKKYPDHIIL